MSSSVVTIVGRSRRTSTPAFPDGISPSSILGMYAFSAAAFIVAARMAHWYGSEHSPMVLFPLVLIFGGLAQFLGGTQMFRTRDAVALILHGTWGSFWTAYGILEILYATGRVSRPTGAFPELGFWYVAIASITWALAFASRRNLGISAMVTLLAAGSTVEAYAEIAGVAPLRVLAGYLLMASALLAWYVGSNGLMRFVRINEMRPPVSREDSEQAA